MTRLACLGLVLLCCGCGADRTGRAKHPLILTLGGPSVDQELSEYADAVARLSSGTLRIRIVHRRSDRTAEPEHDFVADVRAGRVDLGAVGTRAWDAEGAPSFAAFGAPLLLDSFALEADVIRSGVAAPMLRSLRPLGLAGIGVLPGPLRRPFGVTGPLRTPGDYRDLRIGTFQSRGSEAMVRALGATPVDVPADGTIRGLDGVEAFAGTVLGNRYAAAGGYLTTNVVLSARPFVLFASSRRFAALTPDQRSVLTRAAAQALPPRLARLASDDREAAAVLCRGGRVRFVRADAAALRGAVAPVYRKLERDPATRTALGAMAALKRRSTSPADTLSPCHAPAPARVAPPTPFDGVYRMVTSLEHDSADDGHPVPENYGVWIYVFTRGRFATTQENGPACTWSYGTYTVTGDRVEWRFTDAGGISPNNALNKPGEDFVFRWNRYRDTMTVAASPGAVSPANFFLQPWRRIASAPTRRYFPARCPPPAAALR